jgi:hypothetical protein
MKLNEMFITRGQILESDRAKLPKGVLCRGVWPICNIGQINQNNRVYEKAVWEKVLADAAVTDKMGTRTLFGQAEHPEKTQSDLQLTSHVITGMHFGNVTEAGQSFERAFQQIDVLDTPCGRIINTLLEAGCQVGMSTRAEGDLEEKEDEQGKKFQRVIPESYKYVTTDFTADPSTFNVAPVKIESSLMNELEHELKNENLKKGERQFATMLLESMRKRKDGEPQTLEHLINDEMVKLGVGIIIREDKEEKKGKIISLEEGKVNIQLENGTTIALDANRVVTNDGQVEIIVPDTEVAPEVEAKPGIEQEELEAEAGLEEEPTEELPPEEEREFESKEKTDEAKMGVDYVRSAKGSMKSASTALKGKDYDEAAKHLEDVADDAADAAKAARKMKRDAEAKAAAEKEKEKKESTEIPESYEQMVDWLSNKFKDKPIQDIRRFGNLVRTKILNEKVTPSVTDKEIRQLKINEASMRAERDVAMEMLEEIEAKLKSIGERSPLEVRILAKKLTEAKHTDVEVAALCKRLEESKKVINDKSEELTKAFATMRDKEVQHHAEVVALTEEKKKEFEKIVKEADTKYRKQLVESYIGLKLGHSGLKVHRNARALLEKCSTTADVDEVFGDIKEAMRRDALRPGLIDGVTVRGTEDPKTKVTKDLVKTAMSGMK